MFLGSGDQATYNSYYSTSSFDTTHSEVEINDESQSIARLQLEKLMTLLGGFFDQPRRVLDFGCGEARLLLEMARRFPDSTFIGFEPGIQVQDEKSAYRGIRGLSNLSLTGDRDCLSDGSFDLVISSHVVEHILDFGELDFLSGCTADGSLLYIEVPDALSYEKYDRREFLYYFDRLHVNHFTAQSLCRLFGERGFGFADQVEYAFPYRDGGSYPAIGVLFERGKTSLDVSSPSLMEASRRYLDKEKARAAGTRKTLSQFEEIMIWGAGDNFYRSLGNEGPISAIGKFILLDRNPQSLQIGDAVVDTVDPEAALRRYPWPVVVMVSQGKQAIAEQIARIDPHRQVFFL